VEPSLPADWPGFELNYRHGSTVYEIRVMRHEDELATLELDGVAVGFIPLDETGRTYRVVVRLPQAAPVLAGTPQTAEVAVPVS